MVEGVCYKPTRIKKPEDEHSIHLFVSVVLESIDQKIDADSTVNNRDEDSGADL